MHVYINLGACILFGQNGLLGASIETNRKIVFCDIKLFLIIYLDIII